MSGAGIGIELKGVEETLRSIGADAIGASLAVSTQFRMEAVEARAKIAPHTCRRRLRAAEPT